MSGQWSESKGNSGPMKLSDQQKRYLGGLESINYSLGNDAGKKWDAPELQTLGDGDYKALEESMLKSRTAPLDSAWTKRREEINQDVADRGLYASGIGPQEENRIFAKDFLPAYQQAGAEANAATTGMKREDLGMKYDAAWDPYRSALQLFQGSGGQTSKQSSNSDGMFGATTKLNKMFGGFGI